MPQTNYGDISPRTAAYAAKQLLERGLPYLIIEKFGQAKPLPANNSKTITFRRYEALALATTPLTEGVTPAAKTMTKTDISATVVQYGDRIEITDVVNDTHEDPVLMEATDILGEQAAQTVEDIRFGVIKAGTNVSYQNQVAGRSTVINKITLADQRRATRSMKSQLARKITRVIRSTASYGTESVAPSFVALVHSDCEGDIRDMTGFVPTEKYGQLPPYESEIGKVEDVRYVASTVFTSWADAGGLAATNGMLSTTGTQADVYPVLYIARDAYGLVPLKGKTAITPMVVNPTPSDSDPLAQRGHVAWKTMQTAVILNDLWMLRLEVCASA